MINLLCDRALTLTFTKQAPVVHTHIFYAAAEQILGADVVAQRRGKQRKILLVGLFAVAFGLGFFGGSWYG